MDGGQAQTHSLLRNSFFMDSDLGKAVHEIVTPPWESSPGPSPIIEVIVGLEKVTCGQSPQHPSKLNCRLSSYAQKLPWKEFEFLCTWLSDLNVPERTGGGSLVFSWPFLPSSGSSSHPSPIPHHWPENRDWEFISWATQSKITLSLLRLPLKTGFPVSAY